MRLATRVFLLLAGIDALIFAALIVWIGTDLSARVRDLAVADLSRTVRAASISLGDTELIGSTADSVADALGEALEARFTIIHSDGRVLGDSEVPLDRLPTIESHADRPEVRAARETGLGWAERASETVAQSLLYVAVPAGEQVMRASLSTERVYSSVSRARSLAFILFATSLAMLWLAARFLASRAERGLATTRETLKHIAMGDVGRRTGLRGFTPFESIGQAVDLAADRLQEQTASAAREGEDLKALFDGLEEGLAVVDREGLVRLANPAFERWAGRTVGVGERFSGLFRTPKVVAAAHLASRGQNVTEELQLGDHTLLMSARPHRGGALLVFRDLTALRRLEGVRRDFVANVSHELKTPLTSIVGFAEAIGGERELPESRLNEFGGRILANAQRMRHLVDDLLDLALVESGSWRPRREPVSVAEVARETWAGLPEDAKPEGVSLETGPDVMPSVNADLEAVGQILRNLLDNAGRYAPAGSAIRVSGKTIGPMLRVQVADEGPGIASAHLPRVFERFYRIDPARSRERGGTGLGLAIVKHLVVAHGGEVGIESEVGRGTTVWFTLPVQAQSPRTESLGTAPGTGWPAAAKDRD